MTKAAQQHRADPQPFTLPVKDSDVACLLVHGFTGSPPEMRPVGEYLQTRGIHVEAPLLPGHGTTLDDLNRVRWQDWMAEAEQGLLRLMDEKPIVFAAGLSLGSLIAAELAVRHPRVAGIMLYSPPLQVANRLLGLAPLAKYFIRSVPKGHRDKPEAPDAQRYLWHYDQWPLKGAAELLSLQRIMRQNLPKVSAPALVIYSACDTTIAKNAGRRTFQALGSADKKLVCLPESNHVITVDIERDIVCAHTFQFIMDHIPAMQRNEVMHQSIPADQIVSQQE